MWWSCSWGAYAHSILLQSWCASANKSPTEKGKKKLRAHSAVVLPGQDRHARRTVWPGNQSRRHPPCVTHVQLLEHTRRSAGSRMTKRIPNLPRTLRFQALARTVCTPPQPHHSQRCVHGSQRCVRGAKHPCTRRVHTPSPCPPALREVTPVLRHCGTTTTTPARPHTRTPARPHTRVRQARPGRGPRRGR